MDFNASIWEYFINFLEILLFYLFINTRLRVNTTLRYRLPLQFTFLLIRFIVQCIMNHYNLPVISTIITACFLEILFAILFYDNEVIMKVFWGFMYSVICMVAEYISMFIPQTFSDISSPEVLLGGTLRIPFSMLYIVFIAVFVFLFRSFDSKNIILSPIQKVSYLAISVSGIVIGYYIMILTMKAETLLHNPSFTSSMIMVNLSFIILFLCLLLYIYQLGYSKEINIRLLEEQKLLKLEETEYQNLIQSTERLREMKHDINIHLDVIQSLVTNENKAALLSYIREYHLALEETHHLISTGNTSIDCILSSKIHEAQKAGIEVEFSIVAPEIFPLDALSLSSLLGNLWNNALEACHRLWKVLPDMCPYILFYIKPFHSMILIHIENTFDGILKMNPDQTYASTKDCADNGIGLKRIYDIIEKADGIIQIDTNNNIFSVHIMIPMKEVSDENENNHS